MSYEPTLTVLTDNNPMPRVLVAFSSFAPGTTTVNVWRTSGTRQYLVRGGVGLAVAGGAGLVDLEAPAVPSTYFAEMFASDGSTLGFTGATTTVPVLANTWVHNPFQPTRGVAVTVAAATAAQIAGQVAAAIYYPAGRRAGVAVTGQRAGIPAAKVVVRVDSNLDSDAIDAMFGPTNGELGLPPFVCIRFSSAIVGNIRLPQPLFLVVPTPTQTPINLIAGGQRNEWDLTGAEVDPPAAALAETILSRADIDAYFTSRANSDGSYSSRLARDTDYNLAGFGS